MKINKLIFFVVFFNLLSCNNEKPIKSKITINEKANQTQPIKQKEVLNGARATIENTKHSLETPRGLKIGEYYASDDNEYSFCANGKLKIAYYPQLFLTGEWIFSNDTIWIFSSEKHEKIGIGEPLPPPLAIPGNYVDQFSDYKIVTTPIEEKKFFVWSELVRLLAEDSEYPYKILEKGINCIDSNWNKFEE